MIFSKFTEETKPYLKSLRYLKDFVSFDIFLKSSWGIPKKYTNGIEVMSQDNSDRPNYKLYSFVVKNDVNEVNSLQEGIKGIFNYNQEKEEKERLFKEKVQELKGMFESKDVNELKKLNFGIDDDILKLKETIENGEESSGHDDLAQEREVQRPEEREEVQG